MEKVRPIEYVVLAWLLILMLPISTSANKRSNVLLNYDRQEVQISSISPNTIFSVKGINHPFYVVGSSEIEVCMTKQCVFELEFDSDMFEDNDEDFAWIRVIKKLHSWSQPYFIQKTKSKCRKAIGMSPYGVKYFKIKFFHCPEDNNILISLRHRALDMKCCMCLLLGLFLFVKAPKLSKSVTFYYTSSTAVGILASALVLIFILSRFIPKKPVAYSFLAGGSTLCVAIFSRIWDNVVEHMFSLYVIAYVFVSGFLTFAYSYHRGPVENPRTHTVIQWAIQICSLVLIYNGTQIPKVSVSIIILVLLYQLTSYSATMDMLCKVIYKIPLSKFVLGPRYKPRKLLSQAEYDRQARIETEKALAELKKFCNSPECSPWKTMSRLESPKRFARFIEGECHISAHEITSYEEDMSGVFDSEDNVGNSNFISEDDDSLDVIEIPVL